MAEAIRVRIIPGCPSRVIAETEEDRELAEATLANVDCGCSVETEAPEAAEPAEEEAEETEPATIGREEYREQYLSEETEPTQEAEEAEAEAPSCSLEPEKPWDESVCGVVAKQAAADVLRRLREKGVVE